MTKSILLAIQSQHAVKILNGEKTLELRKSVPKGFVGWVYIYVTKAKPYLNQRLANFSVSNNEHYKTSWNNWNGKVVARFWFDEYETFDSTKGNPKIYVKACVDDKHAYNYLKGKTGYAWHIKQLEIFDEPKELGDFHYYKTKTVYSGMDCPPYVDEVKQTLRKAPQSWQYAYLKEGKI